MTASARLQPLKRRVSQVNSRLGALINRFPLASFIVLMMLLVGLAALGNRLRQPAAISEPPASEPVPVSIYQVGGTPTVTVQAKVEKSGVITLMAQTGGIVQHLKVKEGAHVNRGSSLMTLSSTYQGANVPALTRKISQKSYQFMVDNYQSQVDALNRTKEIARKGEIQAGELRAINRQSIDDTKNLISLNETILASLDAQLDELTATNVGGANDATILQTQQAKSGVLSALTNLRTGLRTTEYLNDNDKESAQISTLTRDNTIQQLELQEKTLALNKDIAELNVRLAQVNESMMYPASPVAGTVERLHVKPGQAVTPGTVLATIRGDKTVATAVALVTPTVAQTVSRLEPSQVSIGGQTTEILPRSVSQEATDGSLNSVIYALPESMESLVTNNSYITVHIPVGTSQYHASAHPYIPLDAIYQAQDRASVNIVDDSHQPAVAKSITITLGEVTGEYVEVVEGLQASDRVILDRHIVAGEAIVVR